MTLFSFLKKMSKKVLPNKGLDMRLVGRSMRMVRSTTIKAVMASALTLSVALGGVGIFTPQAYAQDQQQEHRGVSFVTRL